MGPSEQVKVFKELFESSRFEAVLQYYSGFTKLDNPDIQEFISLYQNGKSHLEDLLPLLYCLYEAQQPSLCQLVDPRFDSGELYCNFQSPVDHLVVGYFITSLLSTSTSRMSCVHISYKFTECEPEHGLQLLLSELSKYPVGGLHTTVGVSRKVKLNISGNSEQGAKHIASYLKQSLAIISDLTITDYGGDGMLHVIEALQTNSSLTELHLINSIIPKLAEQTSSVFSKMLQINKSLKLLEVSENGVCMHLAPVFCSIIVGLQHNNTLVNMSLSVDSITAADQDTDRSLTKMLQVNKSLTCLHLSLNFESGARCMYEGHPIILPVVPLLALPTSL